MDNTLVLIIEDDEEMLRLLTIDLKTHGYQVITATDGLSGLRLFHEHQPALVVLDIALPVMDGWTVCQRIREQSDVPILMMTAHAVSEEEIVAGLELGADEYMLKPLRNLEFHARVKALLRRAGLAQQTTSGSMRYRDDYLSIDLKTRRVSVNGKEIRLTPTEFKLLAMFIEHPDEVLTFQEILEHVWGPEYSSEHHYPRIYVSHLRRKIEPDVKNPTYIQNEYGVGYRFVGINKE